MAETVIINEVNKNDKGWYEISLRDDTRVLSTRDRKLADVAMAARGTEIEVDVNTVEKPGSKFPPNHYLNSIGGEKGERPKRAASNGSSGGYRAEDPAKQKVIEREWAYGRASELLAATDLDFAAADGFTDEGKAFLTGAADWLLAQIHA